MVREIQSTCFNSELISIRKDEPLNKHSKIISLTPIIDRHGILRANGRLRNFPKEFFDNCPIILDSHHYVSRLLIKYYHEKFELMIISILL